jgi:hypothetical protein
MEWPTLISYFLSFVTWVTCRIWPPLSLNCIFGCDLFPLQQFLRILLSHFLCGTRASVRNCVTIYLLPRTLLAAGQLPPVEFCFVHCRLRSHIYYNWLCCDGHRPGLDKLAKRNIHTPTGKAVVSHMVTRLYHQNGFKVYLTWPTVGSRAGFSFGGDANVI